MVAQGLLNIVLLLLLLAILLVSLFSLSAALWLYIVGCVFSMGSTLLERTNLRGMLSNVTLKGGISVHGMLSQQTGAGRWAMLSGMISATLLWHGRIIPVAVQLYYGLRGVASSTFIQFSSLLVPRWLGFPFYLLLLAILVFLSVGESGFGWPQYLAFWILAFNTLLFMTTVITISFSKFVSGNLTHPLVNAAMTGIMLGLVAAMIVAIAASQVDGSAVSFAAGVSKVLNIWPLIAGIDAETVSGLAGAVQQQPRALLYSTLTIAIVASFYVSTAKALLSGAITGRSERDHAVLAGYFRERGALDLADRHVSQMVANSSERAQASAMLHIAKGQPNRAYEAAGRIIAANNGVDKSEHRLFILSAISAMAIPDAMPPAQRADRAMRLLTHLTAMSAHPALVTLGLSACLAAGHLDSEQASAFLAQHTADERWEPYARRGAMLIGAFQPESPQASSTIAAARAHVADSDADLVLRAAFFGSLHVVWENSDYFIKLTGEHPAPGDSFPEAVPHIHAVIRAVRDLPADVDTATIAMLFHALGVALHIIHEQAGSDVVDSEILSRLNDWQRQISDDILNMDMFSVASFAKSIAS